MKLTNLQLPTKALTLLSAILVALFGLTTGAGATSLSQAPKNIELQKTLALDAEDVIKVGHRHRRHWRKHRHRRYYRHRYYNDYPYRYRYGYSRHRHWRKHRRHRRLKRHIRRFLRHQLRHHW